MHNAWCNILLTQLVQMSIGNILFRPTQAIFLFLYSCTIIDIADDQELSNFLDTVPHMFLKVAP